MRKIIALAGLAVVTALAVAGCGSQADTVSENLSTEAEKFNIVRRIVGINGITDKVEFVATGPLLRRGDGLGNLHALTVICKGPGRVPQALRRHERQHEFHRHADPAAHVSEFRTTFVIKPEGIVPNFDLVTSG